MGNQKRSEKQFKVIEGRSNPRSFNFSVEQDRRVRILDGIFIGDGEFKVIAGPCAVESEAQIILAAKELRSMGVSLLRGGAFKPRTSPYSFQGLGREGLEFLKVAKEATGMAIVSELLDVRDLDLFLEYVDIIQVGSRNMYNYPLLKELGRVDKPVLLKRGFMATVDEYVGAAEYVLSMGNKRVILCERGVRGFVSEFRFSLDLSIVPLLRDRLPLPVIVDPSHGVGISKYVAPMALASAAVGADGVMIEVHPDPSSALSDGRQALTLEEAKRLITRLKAVSDAVA